MAIIKRMLILIIGLQAMDRKYILMLNPVSENTFRIVGVCAISKDSIFRRFFSSEESAIFLQAYSHICNQDYSRKVERISALISEFL